MKQSLRNLGLVSILAGCLTVGTGYLTMPTYASNEEQDNIQESEGTIKLQKNQLTEEERTVMKYIKNLKDEGMPDKFIMDHFVIDPGGIIFSLSDANGCLAPNFETSSHYFRDCLSYLIDQTEEETTKSYEYIIKDYIKCPLLSFRNKKNNLCSLIGIAYKIAGDKKPEIGLIAINSSTYEGSEGTFILYEKKRDEDRKFIKKKFKYDSQNKSETIEESIVSENDLNKYYDTLKILINTTYNRGYLENLSGKLQMEQQADEDRKRNEKYLKD